MVLLFERLESELTAHSLVSSYANDLKQLYIIKVE
nr:MAG TPA: hypothetical protein [Caudoviricetes sp.]